MKYRCLTDEELQELEEEFKQFLIANGVHAEEWEELNKKEDDRVMQLVEIFSDIVMEKALTNIKFLEHTTPTDIKAFACFDKEMVLIGVTSANKALDFTKNALADFKDKLSIFKTNKVYSKQREEEVFQLLESGCSIIDENRFKKLELAYVQSIKFSQN